MRAQLTDDLQHLLGEQAFVGLVEAFGGLRLYVPTSITSDHAIARAIGSEAAQLLASRYAPAVIRVPLARKVRAMHYRASGASNAAIARKLGMTEPGVEQLFERTPNAPAKGSAQFSLFD